LFQFWSVDQEGPTLTSGFVGVIFFKNRPLKHIILACKKFQLADAKYLTVFVSNVNFEL
jgi:hypothetical protein